MRLEDKIKQIEAYGALGYSAEYIAHAMELTSRMRMILTDRLNNPNDVLAIAYNKGFAIAQREIDTAVADQAQTGDETAIEVQATRSKQRSVKELKKELFGV